MSKGARIREMIRGGASDSEILAAVDTTANSVRWHRSKLKVSAAPAPAPAYGPEEARLRAAVGMTPRTVGEALVVWGLVDVVRGGLGRLATAFAPGFDVERVYKDLASWRFVTNATVTTRLGQCSPRRRSIEIHDGIMGLTKDRDMTMLHEVAHALDFIIHVPRRLGVSRAS